MLAFAEDRAVFDGYAAADIDGIRPGSSNASIALPAEATGYPQAIAQALSELRAAGRERALRGGAERRRLHRGRARPPTTATR